MDDKNKEPHYIGYLDAKENTTFYVAFFALSTMDQHSIVYSANLDHAWQFQDRDTAFHFGSMMWSICLDSFDADEKTMRVYHWQEASVAP